MDTVFAVICFITSFVLAYQCEAYAFQRVSSWKKGFQWSLYCLVVSTFVKGIMILDGEETNFGTQVLIVALFVFSVSLVMTKLSSTPRPALWPTDWKWFQDVSESNHEKAS